MSLYAWLRERWRAWRAPVPLGRRGERAAERYLRRLGYTIVARGERDRLAEIDLIAVDGRTVVFVEVKTRAGQDAGHPAEAVDQAKQDRLVQAALHFLRRHDLLECAVRFDVLAITWPDERCPPRIEHLKNAFEPRGLGQFFR